MSDSEIWQNQLVATWSHQWKNMLSPQELDAIKSSCTRIASGHAQADLFYLHTPPQRVVRCATVSKHCQTLLSIICIGEFGVGKSALLHRFATGDFNEDFNEDFNPTIDKDYLVAAYQIDSTEGRKDESGTIEVHYYDSAGQERFKLVDSHWQYPRMIHTILLAYSVDDRSSFEKLRYWLNLASARAMPYVSYVVVACKCDLPHNDWHVSSLEGRSLAAELGCRFVETSAKENLRIEQLYNHAVSMGLDAFSDWQTSRSESGAADTTTTNSKPHHVGKRISKWISLLIPWKK